MQQAFLIIISVLGAIYAFATRQIKIGFGLLVVGTSFVFSIPFLVTSGVWTQVFEAVTMILFALGILIIIYKRRTIKPEEKPEQKENG